MRFPLKSHFWQKLFSFPSPAVGYSMGLMGPLNSSEVLEFDGIFRKPIRTTTRGCLAGALFVFPQNTSLDFGDVFCWFHGFLEMKKTRNVIWRRVHQFSARNVWYEPIWWQKGSLPFSLKWGGFLECPNVPLSRNMCWEKTPSHTMVYCMHIHISIFMNVSILSPSYRNAIRRIPRIDPGNQYQYQYH